MTRWVVIVLACLTVVSASGQGLDGVAEPLAVTLNVGAERRIDWPAAVEIAMPDALNGVLTVQNLRRSSYWLARAPFPPTRVLVRELDSDNSWLLNVSAEKGEREQASITIERDTNALSDSAQAPYVSLVRAAAAQLFAPARLSQLPSGFVREPVRREPIELIAIAKTRATPIGQWRFQRHFVTAVEVQNLNSHAIVLDARLLRGDWLGAAFMQFRLQGTGSDADSAVIYLVTQSPFDERREVVNDAR
ncbi:MAG TPA: DUF3438 family protein [Woeseiaceae bacterium]|nr:DUF3438 family protein [Woeseiaceae bacterium]